MDNLRKSARIPRIDEEISRNDPMTSQARNAFLLGLIAAPIGAAGFIVHLLLIGRDGTWQRFPMMGALLALLAASIAVMILSRKGKTLLAGWVLILAISQLLIARSLLLSVQGNLVGLAGLALMIFIALWILPQKQSRWAFFVGILILVITRFLAVFSPFQQSELVNLDRSLVLLSWAAVLWISFLLIRNFQSFALTNKLLLVFLVVSILVTYTSNQFNRARTEESLTESVGLSLSNLGASQAQSIGDVLDAEINSVISMSLDSLMQRTVKSANWSYINSPPAVEAKLVEEERKWAEAVAANQPFSEVISNRLDNEVAQELKKFVAVFPLNLQMILTDMHGGLVATTDRNTDFFQGDESWWKSAFNNRRGILYIGQPMYDAEFKDEVIVIAVPVVDRDNGSTVGILRAAYSMDGIAEIIDSLRLGETGRVELFIPDSPSYPDFSAGPTQLFQNGLLTAADQTDLNRLAGMAGRPYGEMAYQDQTNFVSLSNVRAVRPSSSVDNLGWWLLVYQDKAEILAPVVEQTQQADLLSSLILGLVSMLAILLSQFLAGPLVRLTQVAEKISAGDLAAQAKVETDDEVGNLAFSFNAMTDRLRQTLSGLEHRVAERTRELSLAGDVGRELSQERDLDRLMETAVNMIQSSFEMYYTQIYLLDPNFEALVLRAGTGTVGEELMRRSHRLPLGRGSINGMAAFEMRPIVVADTQASPLFRPNPLLPKTRSEMAAPLMIGERIVGVLDMQSSQPGAFSDENLPAFRALAGQLAIAIENASLFEQAQIAHQEMEDQARRLTRSGWQEFLDAIQRKERIGFEYDRRMVKPMDEAKNCFIEQIPIQDEQSILRPIQVAGENVGVIRLEKTDASGWVEEEKTLVQSIAAQVARQIDNLRLLAQAEQFRQEAEDAARLLTREGWEMYFKESPVDELQMEYDHLQVLRRDEPKIGDSFQNVSQVIEVRGESIGELKLDGIAELDEESQLILHTIADRLAAHIENLRLSTQTQQALGETEMLYAIIAKINAAQSYAEILNALVEKTVLRDADRLALMGIFDKGLRLQDGIESQHPKWIYPVAYRSDSDLEIRERYPYRDFEPTQNALIPEQRSSPSLIIMDELELNNESGNFARAIFLETDGKPLRSLTIPLILGDQMIGFVQGYFDSDIQISEREVQRLVAAGGQAAIAVQSLLLLEKAQRKANQEQRIREVSAQVFSAVDIDAIMRKTVEQVGQALGKPAYIVLGQGDAGTDKLRT